MSHRTTIEWTDATWNPVRGCSKVSLGCENCYAEKFAERFRGVQGHPFERGFDLTLVPHLLKEPLHWRTPKKVFVCSMSDLFHEDIPIEYLQSIFRVMEQARWHTFQILTKRSSRLIELRSKLTWTSNLWIGATIESSAYTVRSHHLRSVPAAIKFLSLEPLLGPIPDLPLDGINWVIVGGESGSSARPLDLEWVRNIRDQCAEAHVPFFFKQLGGRRGKRGKEEAVLDGQQWHEFPIIEATPALS